MIKLTTIEQNKDEIAYRLTRLHQLARKGLIDPAMGTLTVQGRLLAEHAMGLTPPKTIGQGTRRVRFDLEKIFHPIKPGDLDSKSLAKIARAGDRAAWDFAAKKINKPPLGNTTAVEPTEDTDAYRDNRGRAKKTMFVTLRPDLQKLRDVIKRKQANVGWARAGWLRGYLALGGTRAPSWVTRHTPGNGTFDDGRQNANPYIACANNTGWGKLRSESDRIMSAALKARANAMRSYYEAIMKQVAAGQLTEFQAQQAAISQQFAA